MSEPVIIGDATLWYGDCLEVMSKMPDNSVAAIVCDPPYLLNFMGKAFDQQHKALPGANEGQKMQAWHARWVAEAFRILKPGGFLAAFGGDRTHHRLLAAMEDEGFELKQNLYFCFGSGFPKATDASKMLDKKAGATREVVWQKIRGDVEKAKSSGSTYAVADANKNNKSIFGYGIENITAPATEAAKKWAGFKTALKPAVEPICVGRKPMVGTLADNLLAWGCGALNIDATRVGTDDGTRNRPPSKPSSSTYAQDAWTQDPNNRNPFFASGLGRYPAHLLHDGSPEVVEMFPVTTSGTGAVKKSTSKGHQGFIYGKDSHPEGTPNIEYRDTGSAARFFQSCPYDADDFDPLFYSGKAAKRDREEGCGGLEERPPISGRANITGNAATLHVSRSKNPVCNHHVSVKPTALMRWLVRLFTPPGETVLDPFMGSGSTLKAALLENKTCIGIEMDPEYFAIAVERIKHVSPDGFTLESPT